ncbi:MAG TPA: methylmalonyl-CoA mutase family protein, partial [Longimicrobiales bacterium]|nr:methylmalonyl-CoA mutase family protein [Longimicrobiales bacterium]
GGSTLTAQQRRNNVARVTLQALAAVLGGTQSLHTNSYDEALALPTEDSARIALRTQQILAHESGVAKTADPLAGSYYVERLTDEIEERARDYVEKIDERGGAARAVEYMQEEIHRSAYRWQREIERGERTVVGVNAYREESAGQEIEQPDFTELEEAQTEKLAALRQRRDRTAVRESLEGVRSAARSDRNLLPRIVDAVKALATLGEISDVLRDEWGTYDAR